MAITYTAVIANIIPELKDMSVPEVAFVGFALFLFCPIGICVLFLMSKDRYEK